MDVSVKSRSRARIHKMTFSISFDMVCYRFRTHAHDRMVKNDFILNFRALNEYLVICCTFREHICLSTKMHLFLWSSGTINRRKKDETHGRKSIPLIVTSFFNSLFYLFAHFFLCFSRFTHFYKSSCAFNKSISHRYKHKSYCFFGTFFIVH